MDRKRLSGGLLALGAAAAFSFGAITNIATADHYHVNCNNHGLVHGSSTVDSNYYARVEGTPCQGNTYCMTGQYNSGIYYQNAGPGVTCNAPAPGYGPECAGWAKVELLRSGPEFSYHQHYAHNRC